MIRVSRTHPPPNFEDEVKKPGMRFLRTFLINNTKPQTKDWKNKDYWKCVREALRKDFHQKCGYLSMREHGEGEVDHFISKSEAREKAYEWTNYRFANAEVSKKKLTAETILDPFDVEDGWFRVDLRDGNGPCEIQPFSP